MAKGFQGFQPGHRKFGGRKPGSISKHRIAASNIKLAAQSHGLEIVQELWRIVSAKSHKPPYAHCYDADARIKACAILLERGYGRPAQEVTASVKKHFDDFSDEEIAIVLGVSLEDIHKQDALPDGDDLPTDPTKLN